MATDKSDNDDSDYDDNDDDNNDDDKTMKYSRWRKERAHIRVKLHENSKEVVRSKSVPIS